MKKIILITIIGLMLILKLDIVFAEKIYSEYKVGDKITYNGMEFYVIENSDKTEDYVTTLKVEPLKTEEMSTLIDSTEVSKYVSDTNGYLSIPYSVSDTCTSIGIADGTANCIVDYNRSSVKQIVDVWKNAHLKESDLSEDNSGYKVRLLMFEELINNLGYNEGMITPSDIGMVKTENTPSWVSYRNQYWTMSVYEDSNYRVYVVNYENIEDKSVADTHIIRPIINFKKNAYINNNKSLNDKNFEIGDIVEYDGTKFYVIKNSKSTDETLTLIKAEPLTVEEVNKYGVGYINKYTKDYQNTARDIDNYGGVAYYSSENCRVLKNPDYVDLVEGCSTNYNTSDIKKILDSWVDATIKKEELGLDYLGYNARLLTIDEIKEIFAYVGQGSTATPTGGQGYYKPTLDTYGWFLELKSCWTMTGVGDYSNFVYVKESNDDIGVSSVYHNYSTICPVITLKKQNYDINNQTVSVPDTFLAKSIIIIVIGLLLIVMGIVVGYIVIKKKKVYKK